MLNDIILTRLIFLLPEAHSKNNHVCIMSFQVNKDTSGKVVKKALTSGTDLEDVAIGYNVSAPSALFNTRNYAAEVATVTTTSGPATFSNSSLDILSVTPGTASAGKALISDSNNTISGLNVVRCKSIRANGVLIDPAVSAETAVPATDYFTGVTSGVASASKVLVVDNDKSISGIKKVYGRVKDLVEFGSEQSAGMTFANNVILPAGDYYDITYSVDLQKYLVVGKNITLLSTSGSTWTTNVTSLSITFVKWIPHKGRFYGVAPSGIYTSQDGITWDQAFAMTGLTGIAVGYNTAIAVGPSKQYYSADSITWTSVTTADANYAITYGDSKFMIVGTNISKTATDTSVPVFTVVTIAAGSWRGVEYGNGTFIAINGTAALVNKFLTSTSGNKWSTDTNTWNPVESELTTGWDRIYFLNDYFYVVSLSPAAWETQVYYTRNGTEWYRFKHPLDGQLAGIAYSPVDKKMVFASRGSDISKDYTNGVTLLRPRPCAFPRFTYSGTANTGPSIIKEVNGLIFGMSTDCLFVSTDGYKFQKAYLDVSGVNQFDTIARSIQDVAYSSSLGIYIAASGYWIGVYGSLMKSTDGLIWTEISTAPAGSAGSIVWSSVHSKFIVSMNNEFAYSFDGITWTSVALTGCRFIQIVDSVVYVAHSSSLSTIGTNMSTTLITNTGYGSINQFIKAGSTFYRSDSGGVWSSSNLLTWTNMVAFTNPTGLVYIPELDIIVTFTSDNYVRAYSNSTWYSSLMATNCLPLYGTRFPCWSATYKKIYASHSFGNGAVCATSSLIGQTVIASLLKPTVYKTLPSYLDSVALQDDNFYKAIQRSNSIVSFGGFTFTGSTEITKLIYDRGNNFWVGLKTAPTTANPAVRFANGFSGQLSAINLYQYIPYSLDSSLYMYNDGANQNLQMALLTSATALGTILNSAVSGTLTFAVNRFKKNWHRNFFYHFNGSYYYFYRMYPSLGTGTLVNFATIIKTETSVDYTTDKDGDYLYVLMATPAIIKRKIGLTHAFAGNVDGTFVKSTALSAGTYYQLEYFKDKFILTKSDKVLYSSNGETWTEAFTGAFTRHNMNYIRELDIMTIVTTNIFAYSRDGSTWIQLTTPTSDAWTSCDYNARAATFILHARTTGRILLTSPIMITTTNICAPVGMYASGNKLSHYALGQNITPYNQTHALDTTGSLSNDQISGPSCNFSRSSNTLTLTSSTSIKLTKTDNSVPGLKINGIDSSISETALRGLSTIKLTDQTNKNGIAVTNKFGNLKAGDVSLTTLTNNEIAPLLTADSNRNISLDTLGSQAVVINERPLKYTQVTSPARSYSITDYLDFKLGTFTNSVNGIYDSAYSSTLDILVLLINGNSTGTGDAVAVSKDKGQTWTRIRLNVTSVYGATDYNRKILWSPEANAFISVGNNVVYYSYNGYTWTTLTVSFGSNPHVFYDSKTSRIAVVCGARVAYAPVSDISNWAVITTMTIAYQQVEYSPSDDLYYVISRVLTNVSTTPNIYTATAPVLTTRVTTSTAYYLQYFKGSMYYIDTVVTIRKNITGTSVFTSSGRACYRLQYEPSLDILLAFSSYGFFWTSNATTWNWVTYPAHEINYNLNAIVDGYRNEFHFVGDRVILTSNVSGNVLVSDTIVTKKTIAPSYLEEIVQNRSNIDTLGNANSYNSELFIRHSNTNRSMYAAAYGAGKYLSVGTDVNMYGSNLKQTPIYSTHTGNWVDVVYDGSRFVKISSTLISYATTPNSTWIDSSLPSSSSWFKLLHNSGVYTIVSSSEIKTSSNLTDWIDNTPPAFGVINGAEYVNGSLVVLGVDKIYTGSAVVSVQGTWYDIAYGKGLYLLAGNGFMARGRSLTSLKRTFVPKDYHSVVYVRPLNDFFLLSKTVASAQAMARYMYAAPTNHIIRSPDGLIWYPGLNFTTRSTTLALTYNMSGLYYFEGTDQFFIPLNNTTNKICMYSNYTVANKANVKITTPSSICLGTIDGSIDVARGSDMTTASPLRFNVFQDSAAKPATSTWTTASDRRVKEDIVPADLNICVDNVKNMPLKYYKWRDQYLTSEHSNDRHRLGWIAQDVEKVLPKSVGKLNLFGMEDCRTLNNDQIVANMYGAIKMLVKKIEEKEQAVDDAGL